MAQLSKSIIAGAAAAILAGTAATAMPLARSAAVSGPEVQRVSSHVPGLFRDYYRQERDAAKRRHPNLPRKHIEYCNRLVAAYRQSDNTIAYDRYTRVQCFSPYYRPY